MLYKLKELRNLSLLFLGLGSRVDSNSFNWRLFISECVIRLLFIWKLQKQMHATNSQNLFFELRSCQTYLIVDNYDISVKNILSFIIFSIFQSTLYIKPCNNLSYTDMMLVLSNEIRKLENNIKQVYRV